MTSYPVALNDLNVRAPSERSLLVMLIGVCVFSAALGRFCFLLRPFDNDAAIFIYMGKMVTDGGRLCRDLIDNKFPTVGLMTSVVYRLLDTCWPAYIALQAAISAATAISLGRTAARVAGPAARLPATLFALVFLNFTTAVFGGFQLETIQVFFNALAAGACVEVILTGSASDAFVAGLCAGCGMMFKPTAIAVLLAASVAKLMMPRRIIPAGLAAFFGLCIPLACASLYLAQADLWHDMPALYHQISTYAHETVFDSIELIKPLTALVLLGFPILIRGFICRRQRDESMPQPQSAIITFLILWLAIETAGVVLQRRMYAYHFLPMVPPAAILFGLLPRQNRAGSLAGALLPIALLSILQASNLLSSIKPGESHLPLSDYLQQHAKPGDAVWMDAWPRIILETGLRPGARLPFSFLFCNYDRAGLDYSAGMIADFDRIKPQWIILPVPLDHRLQNQIDFIPELNRRPERAENYKLGWHRIQEYTQLHYTKQTMVGNDAVYRRNPD